MEVILIYECASCDQISRTPIVGVSVRDILALEQRLPEGWTIRRNPKETYLCPRCVKEPHSAIPEN